MKNLEKEVGSCADAVHLVDLGHLQVELLLDAVGVLVGAAAGHADGLVRKAGVQTSLTEGVAF
jgi:hypothetical protein